MKWKLFLGQVTPRNPGRFNTFSRSQFGTGLQIKYLHVPLGHNEGMQHREVSAADLLLDVENPRHASANNQREAIDLLLDGMSDKLLRLADDITHNGLSPIDELLVLQNRNGTYTVLEGNRRIAAIKLLANPNLAAGRSIESDLKRLAAKASLPSTIRCSVATSREEAKHWQELRHTGQNEGAGVVPWSAESTQRFRRQKGSQADRAISFLDSIGKAYGRVGAITRVCPHSS